MPSRSTGVTFTASGRSTRPLMTNSRKGCMDTPASGRGGSVSGRFANKAGHRVGSLRSLADPILHPLGVHGEVVGPLQRLRWPAFLDGLPLPRAPIVRPPHARHGAVR